MPRKTGIAEKLLGAGLRPTRQRIALAELIFTRESRHVYADELLEQAILTRTKVSLATIYNALRQFTEAGLLREIKVDGARTCYDTNTSPDHHHFLIEDENRIVDIPAGEAGVGRLPAVPAGYEIATVLVRLRRAPRSLPR